MAAAVSAPTPAPTSAATGAGGPAVPSGVGAAAPLHTTPFPPFQEPPQLSYGWFGDTPPPRGPYLWPCVPQDYALADAVPAPSPSPPPAAGATATTTAPNGTSAAAAAANSSDLPLSQSMTYQSTGSGSSLGLPSSGDVAAAAAAAAADPNSGAGIRQPPQLVFGWFVPKPPAQGPYFWPALPPGYALVPTRLIQRIPKEFLPVFVPAPAPANYKPSAAAAALAAAAAAAGDNGLLARPYSLGVVGPTAITSTASLAAARAVSSGLLPAVPALPPLKGTASSAGAGVTAPVMGVSATDAVAAARAAVTAAQQHAAETDPYVLAYPTPLDSQRSMSLGALSALATGMRAPSTLPGSQASAIAGGGAAAPAVGSQPLNSSQSKAGTKRSHDMAMGVGAGTGAGGPPTPLASLPPLLPLQPSMSLSGLLAPAPSVGGASAQALLSQSHIPPAATPVPVAPPLAPLQPDTAVAVPAALAVAGSAAAPAPSPVAAAAAAGAGADEGPVAKRAKAADGAPKRTNSGAKSRAAKPRKR